MLIIGLIFLYLFEIVLTKSRLNDTINIEIEERRKNMLDKIAKIVGIILAILEIVKTLKELFD
ncbi:MAG: hypothetical protein [Bacteriophage sp.]|nr:MAG: hypothetical protein [Bacteriophage sp.]UWI03247.1 MAG: hypothetical protein [Bacteriophage sp.]